MGCESIYSPFFFKNLLLFWNISFFSFFFTCCCRVQESRWNLSLSLSQICIYCIYIQWRLFQQDSIVTRLANEQQAIQIAVLMCMLMGHYNLHCDSVSPAVTVCPSRVNQPNAA